MAELFGFKITRKKDEGESFTLPSSDDGTIEVAGGGFYSQTLDVDGRDKTENDLIRRYRDIAIQPECDSAIEDIVSEGIASNEYDAPVALRLDRLEYSSKVKKRINEEFDRVLQLLDFNIKGHDIFRRWYVDGRIYYHKVIDKKEPRKGIKELRYIDPRKIKKVREVIKDRPDPVTGIDKQKQTLEYYLYNEKVVDNSATPQSALKITTDSIAFCPSGLVDQTKGSVLSYLHKAIKPVNQLRMIEDALVIYRISRAPERRIFYIDVGNLPKIKAEQYLKDVMSRYRNKLVYDASTGEIRDDRNHMSMLEDFWLPRREGGRGTEITTLPGGSNLGEIEDIVYFQRKLYRSLNVPMSRMEAEQNFSIGRSTEITRDELKFSKFVQRLRKKFSALFHDVLRTQLVLTGVIAEEEWDKIKEHIQYDFLQDGHFAELRDAEILRERIDMLGQVEPYVGNFFSKSWVRKNILHQTEQEIEEIETEIEEEGGGEEDNFESKKPKGKML
tara:strand:+ start:55 stop:1557 length:1503 start_codon:yes stop_codon:yes gene_type:complete